jgi:signal transduction histidine kinase/CheY-like chemotaxis protein
MAENPAAETRTAGSAPASRRATSGERVAAAALALAGGVAIVAVAVGSLAGNAPNLLLAQFLALGAGVGLWRLTRIEQRRAERANEAKSAVLAAVSHEFRTPLNGILGLTGLLLESDLTADQRNYAKGVRSSGEALLRLVDDMLDFSRIEAGRLELRPEPTDLARMAEEIGELLATRAHDKGIELAIAPARDLPQTVEVDAQRLRQVLLNLLGNAIKFTAAGGVTLSIGREGQRIIFSVEDTGVGIDPAEAERIFGEFEQIDTALNRRNGGAGLGLAISRRIVRHMGGDIALATRPGGGSIFSFSLDLAPVANGAAAAALRDRSLILLGPAGPEAEVIAGQLAAEGAHVRHVADLVDAAALAGAARAASLPYDALLIDARMPLPAAEALSRLRLAAGGALPAAVLIEPGGRGAMPALREAGYDAYLVRPVRRRSLIGVVAGITGTAAGTFHADPEDLRAERREGTTAARRLDILLAEDNEIGALLVRAVLEGLGHRVTEVRDGAAAVEAATRPGARHDVILMDLHMPVLDGLAAARAIRAEEDSGGRRRALILALTADVLAETQVEAAASGIDAVLEKPIAPERLRQKLAEMTSGAMSGKARPGPRSEVEAGFPSDIAKN